MNNVTSKNVFIANVLVILSLLGLFIFTKGAYSEMQEQIELRAGNKAQEKTTEITLNKFKNIKKNIENGENSELVKYTNSFDEANAIQFVFDMLKNSEIEGTVGSVNITKPEINAYGFREVKLDISASIDSEDKIMKLIDNINKSEDHKMFIESFALPKTDKEGRISAVKLPLLVYFK